MATNRNNSRSLFAGFVRGLRRQLGNQSQARFQEAIGYTKRVQYVNKVENGIIIKDIDPDFIAALAKASNRPVADIKAMADSNMGSQEPPLMVFTHCVWAAPLALAALQQVAQRFRIASFYTPRGDEQELPEIEEIQWLDKVNWPTVKLPAPTVKLPTTTAAKGNKNQWINAEDGAASGAEGRETNGEYGNEWCTRVRPVSSVDALTLLEQQKIDVAAVPGDLLQSRSRLVRVAALVDSASGCVLVYKSRPELNETFNKIRSKNTSVVFADELTKEFYSRQLKIELQAGSFPYYFLKEGCARGFPLYCEQKDIEIQSEAFSLANKSRHKSGTMEWLTEFKNAERRLKNQLPQNAGEMLKAIASLEKEGSEFSLNPHGDAILTLQPHATWLEQLNSHDGWRSENICLPFGPNGRPRQVTFDLVIREETATSSDPRSKKIRDDLVDLVGVLAERVELLNKMDTTEPAIDPIALNQLAWYFSLDRLESGAFPQTLIKTLASVRYAAYLYPEFVFKMQSHYRQ